MIFHIGRFKLMVVSHIYPNYNLSENVLQNEDNLDKRNKMMAHVIGILNPSIESREVG